MLLLLMQIVGFAVVAWFLSARILPHAIVFLQRILNVPELSFGLLIGGLFPDGGGGRENPPARLHWRTAFGAALSGLPVRYMKTSCPVCGARQRVCLFLSSSPRAGLHLDLSFTSLPIVTIVALVVFPSLGKFAGAFIGTYVARLDNPLAQATD